MAYYDNVYLKRVNKYGTTIQERIQNKKNHDFLAVIKKSPNQVKILKDNEIFMGILQNKVNSEKENISYLLTFKGLCWKDGTIVLTENQSDFVQKKWLIFHLEEYSSIGYDKYQVVELDREISWLNDNILHTGYGHIVGSGDKSILSKFSIQFDISGIYEPNKVLRLILSNNNQVKKGDRFLFDKEAYKVSGLDRISVPGLIYVTLEEDLYNENDDDVLEQLDLNNWMISTSFGNNQIFLPNINFVLERICTFYFKGKPVNEPYTVEIKELQEESYIKYEPEKGLYCIENDFPAAQIIVRLKNNPKISKIIEVFSWQDLGEKLIAGPELLQIGEIGYIRLKSLDFKTFNFSNKLEYEKDGEFYKIKAIRSGSALIDFIYEDNLLVQHTTNILSEWLG